MTQEQINKKIEKLWNKHHIIYDDLECLNYTLFHAALKEVITHPAEYLEQKYKFEQDCFTVGEYIQKGMEILRDCLEHHESGDTTINWIKADQLKQEYLEQLFIKDYKANPEHIVNKKEGK